MKRIFHTWEKWECYPTGFYEDKPKDSSVEDGEKLYQEYLSDLKRFEYGLIGVLKTWKNSCEHYLSNDRMNRIAWLGQAAICYSHGIPCCCRGGYNRLTDQQKKDADELAFKYLNKWLVSQGEPELKSMDQAASKTQADLY